MNSIAFKSIKLSRMREAGHEVRTSSERTALRVFNASPISKRPRGIPRKRWKICVDEGKSIAGRKAESKDLLG